MTPLAQSFTPEMWENAGFGILVFLGLFVMSSPFWLMGLLDTPEGTKRFLWFTFGPASLGLVLSLVLFSGQAESVAVVIVPAVFALLALRTALAVEIWRDLRSVERKHGLSHMALRGKGIDAYFDFVNACSPKRVEELKAKYGLPFSAVSDDVR